jgi:hypothetical protein
MEFDADRSQVRIAGSEAFVQTVRQLHLLNFASQGAFSDLRELYNEGRLVDDLPRLIMVRTKQASPELMAAIDQQIATSKTNWFDTHPSDADRVAAAEREGGVGAFGVELPAAALFTDFTAQCKATTWDFYLATFNNKVKREQLRPVKDVEARHEAARQGEAALERIFQGEWHTAAPLPVGSMHLAAPDDPQAALAELKQVREKMTALLPQVGGAGARIAATHAKAAEAQTLHYWMRADGKLKKDVLTEWGGAVGIERASKSTTRDLEKAIEALVKYNALAAQRFLLALELAHVPKVAARMTPPPDVDAMHKVFDALQTLCQQMAVLAKIYPRHASMGMLVEALQSGGANDKLASIIRDHMNWLVGPAKQMRAAFARTNYPYDHAKGTLTLAQYLMVEMPMPDDLASIYNSLSQALDLAPSLYVRALGQLVDVAVAAETACGFPAPPQPTAS